MSKKEIKCKVLEVLSFILSFIATLITGAFLILDIHIEAPYYITIPTMGFFIADVLLMARIIIGRK